MIDEAESEAQILATNEVVQKDSSEVCCKDTNSSWNSFCQRLHKLDKQFAKF